MTTLETVQPTIERLVSVLSRALGIDLAVIDEQCHLVASTGTYLQRKGRNIHAPFIQEVLARGEVIASEPGHMQLCTGCRFEERCPATVEISSCIRGANTPPLGVLSLTSFTEEGRNNLNEHRGVFQELLNEISSLIAMIVVQAQSDSAGERASLPQPRRTRRIELGPVTSLDDIKGESPAIRAVKGIAARVAKGNSTLLLRGETGTGKEMFARAIHSLSSRRDFPFVAVNCAGFPDTLLESELFGYDEGAFTGARKGGKPGRFELANGGTVFLDEIGDMPFHLQSKLLRVLQNLLVERVGGVWPVPVDVRVIAATNADLEDRVKNGRFRQDLYYRLNVVPIEIPPLRDREGDIEILARHFLEKSRVRSAAQASELSAECLRVLKSYAWPGNVRELENAIEYAANMEQGDVIQAGSLPPKIIGAAACDTGRASLQGRVRQYERDLLKQTLDATGWDVKGKSRAAADLGIGLRTLYRRIKELGLDRLN